MWSRHDSAREHAGGKVGLFDLRKPEPLVVKDHLYDAPIVDIKFHSAIGDHTCQQRVISADTHVVKVRPRARTCLLLTASRVVRLLPSDRRKLARSLPCFLCVSGSGPRISNIP